jgi:hypothetical protein
MFADPMSGGMFGGIGGGGQSDATGSLASILGEYLRNVMSGQIAAGGALAQNNYDPKASFAQNALNPAALAQATDIAFGIGPGNIRAYHGSPHSFDKFDISKIGTGEGAQAYGHGLYFAENPGVAESYKGLQGRASTDPMANVASKSLAAGHDAERSLRAVFPRATDEQISQAIATAKNPPPGHMYEVDIHADPKAFLDWDKPLSAQPGPVRQALANLSPPPAVSKLFDAEALAGNRGNMPFSTIYGALSHNMGGTRPHSNEAAASLALNQAGIPGIRYLDQGSRNPGFSSITPATLDARIDSLRADIAGGGGNQQKMLDQLAGLERERDSYRNLTHNYAVFDDSLIEILRKYGILGPVAAPAMMPFMGDQQQ